MHLHMPSAWCANCFNRARFVMSFIVYAEGKMSVIKSLTEKETKGGGRIYRNIFPHTARVTLKKDILTTQAPGLDTYNSDCANVQKL